MPDIPWGKLFRKFFSSLSRKAWMAIAAGTVVLAVLLSAFFRSAGDAEGDKQPQEAASVDTLALNIICTPTLDCLPFYHAVESGLCDSLGLQLAIRTERSQFDIDSIMRRTRVYDAAVIDDARLAHYRSVEGKAPKAGSSRENPQKQLKRRKRRPRGPQKMLRPKVLTLMLCDSSIPCRRLPRPYVSKTPGGWSPVLRCVFARWRRCVSVP